MKGASLPALDFIKGGWDAEHGWRYVGRRCTMDCCMSLVSVSFLTVLNLFLVCLLLKAVGGIIGI